MTETQLESLRRELENNYRRISKELVKVNKAKPYFGLIDLPRKKEKIEQERKALKETLDALRKFQETIERGSDKTPEQQEAAYKELQAIKEKYGTSSRAVSKLNINTPFMNTLKVHHNRSVEKNVNKPLSTFLKKTALALVPLAAIPLLPALGLGAIGAALATPLAWVGVALGGRSIIHAIQGRARRIAMNNASKAVGRPVAYSELYPTQSEVKGIFNTYRYNRTIGKTAGRMFTDLEGMKEFEEFKGTKITQQPQTQQQQQQQQTQQQKQNQNSNKLVDDFIKDITNLNIEDLKAVEDMIQTRVGQVIPYVNDQNRDFIETGIKYLNVAKALHKHDFERKDPTTGLVSPDPALVSAFKSIVTEDKNKSKEFNEFRNKLSENLKALCQKLGYSQQFIESYYGPQQRQQQTQQQHTQQQQTQQQQTQQQQTQQQQTQQQQTQQQQRQQQRQPGNNGGPNGSNGQNNGGNGQNGGNGGNGGNNQPPANNDQETFARTPELQKLVFMLREFDVSKMTIENYNAANKLIAKIDGANRVHPKDFHLDADDELTLAEVRSMAEAYEAKTALVDKLKVCEAAIAAGAFYKEAFEDCISEFYNIVGHTTYVSDAKKSTSVRTATSRNLLSREEYERVKKVLQYYKKYSSLTNKSGFADERVQEEETVGRRR